MNRETEEEYRRAPQRYVRSNMGMWTGLNPVIRIVLSPLYATLMWLHCVLGTPVNFQKLHAEDYEPEYDTMEGLRVCPQCQRPKGDEIEVTFRIRGEE